MVMSLNDPRFVMISVTKRGLTVQPIQQLEIWLRTSARTTPGQLYPAYAFRSLFPHMSAGAYRALLHRAQRRGILERVCQGIYQYSGNPNISGLILFHAAALLRAQHFNYISLETVLSEAGMISQIPLAWVTIVSTGRTAQVSCGQYGTIEFVHTERSMSEVIDQLQYVPERRMYMAFPQLALDDMHRFQRPTLDLIQDAPDATV